MRNFNTNFKEHLLYLLSVKYLQEVYKIERHFPNERNLKSKSLYELLTIYLTFYTRFPFDKRIVVFSNEFICNPLYIKFEKRIDLLKNAIETGDNIGLFLSDKIGNIIYNDQLLTDWGITHFHLFYPDERKNYCEDNYVIFSVFDRNTVLLIDLQDHKQFCRKELLEIIQRYNPGFLPNIKGITGEDFKEDEIVMFRKAKVAYSLNNVETVFPTRMNEQINILYCSKLLSLIKCIDGELDLNFEQIVSELRENYPINANLDFNLVFNKNKHDIYVQEANSNIGFSWKTDCFNRLKEMCLFKGII